MNAKWTPGPWRWVADGVGLPDEDGIPGRGPINIATYRAPSYYNNAELDNANGECILGCGEYNIIHGATPKARIANAKLIAMAPELAEVLEWALDQLQKDFAEATSQNKDQQWIDDIDSTIQLVSGVLKKAKDD